MGRLLRLLCLCPRQGIHTLIFSMAAMSRDMLEFNAAMSLHGLTEFCHQVMVAHGADATCPHPNDVSTVTVECHCAWLPQSVEPANRGQQFHTIIGGPHFVPGQRFLTSPLVGINIDE